MDRPRGPAPQTKGCSDAAGSRGSVRIAPQPRELRPQRAGLKNDGLGKPMRPETVHQKSDSLWYHVRTCRERSRRIRRILMHPTPLRRRCQTPRCRTERAGHRCQSALGSCCYPYCASRDAGVAEAHPRRALTAFQGDICEAYRNSARLTNWERAGNYRLCGRNPTPTAI